MSTVIIGGGIIGSSIAYYLSSESSPHTDQEVHVIESSSQLFSGASGYAAGFLAKDWFSSSVAPLGALSFDLHHKEASENGGDEKWGYMKSTALSLDVSDVPAVRTSARDGDWWSEGTSRADAASVGEAVPEISGDNPLWLTRQEGGSIEKIGDGETAAQVDPLRLCKYLMDSCISRGVQLHQPAEATSVITDNATGAIIGIKVRDLKDQTESVIPCTNLVISAGPWTPAVFKSLFPSSKARVRISPLAGYSLVLRSPRHTEKLEREAYKGRSHAVFTTHPASCGFSPEVFSRRGAEIYIAGLNSTRIPLPGKADEAKSLVQKDQIQELKDVSVRLMGKLEEGHHQSSDDVPNTDDLEVLREGLCFRPVTNRGSPIVSRVGDELLGPGIKTGSLDGSNEGRKKGGVFIAAGHGPWGISLSLGTGKVIADMVDGVKTSADISGLIL
ncbi:FAD dependent oxidoreductase superfamily [Paecilomyces variotii No. 5]|uniref:FAD dependent oxidoreductase superfamily n=1 Tax=Byssochlamys spectabilis (strain No. 5 / NBRC 109023) TaxID=1356009 RepID=V5I046_BYSSN|nr:FAD dependent oxidoreductase superfamily [Paecilomyces variotii No. 5]